jgi:predicted DNA-binding transcriptional regulator AlpA
MTNQRKIYRTAAAAERIGVSASTMEKWRCAGTGPPFVKIGRRAVGYWEEALDDFLGASRTSTAQTAQNKRNGAPARVPELPADHMPSPDPQRAERPGSRRKARAR